MSNPMDSRARIRSRRRDRARRCNICGGDGSGYFAEVVTVGRDGLKELDNIRLALALEHAIDGARAVLDNGIRGERGAVAADADEGARQRQFRGFGQIDDFGYIGEVVAGEGDKVRPPLRNQAVIVGVAFDLQIDDPDRVAGASRGLRHEFEAQWLEAEEDIREQQRAGMNEQHTHVNPRFGYP
jgi:hypothetical protein